MSATERDTAAASDRRPRFPTLGFLVSPSMACPKPPLLTRPAASPAPPCLGPWLARPPGRPAAPWRGRRSALRLPSSRGRWPAPRRPPRPAPRHPAWRGRRLGPSSTLDGAGRQPGRPALPWMRCGSNAGPGGSVGRTSSELAISIALVAWVCRLKESHTCPWARGHGFRMGRGRSSSSRGGEPRSRYGKRIALARMGKATSVFLRVPYVLAHGNSR